MKVISMRFAWIFVGLALVSALAESKPTAHASGDSKQRKRSTKGIRHVRSLAIASIEGVSEVPAIEKGLEKNIGEEIKTDPTALTDVNTGSGVKASLEIRNTEGESKTSAKVENTDALSSNSVYTDVAKGKEVVKEADEGQGLTKVAVKGKATTNGKPTKKHGTKHRKHRKRMTHSRRVKTRKAGIKNLITGKSVSVAANLINGPETTYRPITNAVSKKSKKVHGSVKSKTKRKGLARIVTKVKSAGKAADAAAIKVKQSATMSEKPQPSWTEAAVKGNDRKEVDDVNEIFQSKAEIKEDASAGNVIQGLSQQSVTTDSTNIIEVTDRIAKDTVKKDMISVQVDKKESSGADAVPNDAINEVLKDSTNRNDVVKASTNEKDAGMESTNGKDVVKDATNEHDVKGVTNVNDVVKDAANVNDIVRNAASIIDVKDTTNVNDVVTDATNVKDVFKVAANIIDVKDATNVQDVVKDAANIIDVKDSGSIIDVKDATKVIDVVKEAKDVDTVSKDVPNGMDVKKDKHDAETVTKDATTADAGTSDATNKDDISKNQKNEEAVIAHTANVNAFTNEAPSADTVDPGTKSGKIAKKDDTIDENSTKDAIYNKNVNTDGTDRDTTDGTILDGTTNDAADSKNVIKTSLDKGSASKDVTSVNNIIHDALNDAIVPQATDNREEVKMMTTGDSNIKTDESARLQKTKADDTIQDTVNGSAAQPGTTSNVVVNNGAEKMTVPSPLNKLIPQEKEALEVVTHPVILPDEVKEELHLPEKTHKNVEPIEDQSAGGTAAENEIVAVTAGDAYSRPVTPSSAVRSEAIRETKITKTIPVPETATPAIISVVVTEPALADKAGINALQQSVPVDETADKNSILPVKSAPNSFAVAAVTAPTANKIMDPYKSTLSPAQTQELKPAILSTGPPGPVKAKEP